jgi:hypothetical protein
MVLLSISSIKSLKTEQNHSSRIRSVGILLLTAIGIIGTLVKWFSGEFD